MDRLPQSQVFHGHCLQFKLVDSSGLLFLPCANKLHGVFFCSHYPKCTKREFNFDDVVLHQNNIKFHLEKMLTQWNCRLLFFNVNKETNDAGAPFPSSLAPLFQSESKCETILMKMALICMN